MLFQPRVVKPHKPSHNNQQGVVIVIALFIVALVATMAYTMMARLARDTRHTTLILRDAQAEFYAQGSIAWAKDQLRNNWQRQKPKQLLDKTPIVSPERNENSYHIVSTIYDMQARYNLNNLVDPNAQTNFTHMLQAIVPNISEQKAQQITQAIADWVMSSAQQNEFNKYYLSLPRPYRQPHKPMVSVSELRLVRGMTAEIFNALQPYITALPQSAVVNVQTAPAPVLIMIGTGMTVETGKMIEQLRSATPFVSTQLFLNLDVVKNHPIQPEAITVVSNYFLVETDVSIETQHLVLYTLLERKANAGKASVIIVWQSKGVF